MPYNSPSDAPDYIPEDKKAQWIAVFNSAWDKAKEEGKSKEDADASAFAQATGVTGSKSSKKVDKTMAEPIEMIKGHYSLEEAIQKGRVFKLQKVDSSLDKDGNSKRLVYGVITDETPDKSGEICDYDSSKPYYEAWSNELAKTTNGENLGNLREMHKLIAAGKFIKLEYDDDKKEIRGAAKVVDDQAWRKCEEGVYTGFSHGGDYVGEMKTTPAGKRYTAKPAEVSLVDNPCNPQAHFEYVKADGSTELRKFATVTVVEATPETLPVVKTKDVVEDKINK